MTTQFLLGHYFETVMPAKYGTITPNIDLSQMFDHIFQIEDLLNCSNCIHCLFYFRSTSIKNFTMVTPFTFYNF